MSELKAIHAYTFDEVEVISTHSNGNDYYLKSEADKLIAELEEKLNNSRNARKYWRKEYLIEYKECCHHKYKRCLAMALYCEALMREEFLMSPEYIEWLDKWRERWLGLAEQFKEAKCR